MIESNDFRKWFGILFAEAFGVADTESGYFLDSGRAGLLGTIDQVDAQTASAALKPGNATIASHCGHVLFILHFFTAHSRGETPTADWPGSWTTREVDDAAWATLRGDVRREYETIQRWLQHNERWDEAPVAALMILLTHCAYHVGEVRQLLTSLRSQPATS